MTTFHAVVWIDQQEAHVLMFDREHVEAQRIKSRSHHQHQGKATDAAGGCPLFAGKQVAGPGWCSAYAKKA